NEGQGRGLLASPTGARPQSGGATGGRDPQDRGLDAFRLRRVRVGHRMTRTALVTGGAGFVGSALVRALVERDWVVTVLDDFSTGALANLTGVEASIALVRGDVRDREAIRRAVRGAEVVFHLAANVSVPRALED